MWPRSGRCIASWTAGEMLAGPGPQSRRSGGFSGATSSAEPIGHGVGVGGVARPAVADQASWACAGDLRVWRLLDSAIRSRNVLGMLGLAPQFGPGRSARSDWGSDPITVLRGRSEQAFRVRYASFSAAFVARGRWAPRVQRHDRLRRAQGSLPVADPGRQPRYPWQSAATGRAIQRAGHTPPGHTASPGALPARPASMSASAPRPGRRRPRSSACTDPGRCFFTTSASRREM